ncbi:MAG TPA: hypothetical protein VGM88_31130 [Kofleriaceae bacterium]|jgi:hypothetical protein
MAKRRDDGLGDALDRVFVVLDQAPAGLHDLAAPSADLPSGLPLALIELYARCDGGMLFIDSVELFASAAARLEDGRWAFGSLEGEDLWLDAAGRVWRLDSSLDDEVCEGTRIDRYLGGLIDALALLYDGDGEFADGVFDENGELLPAVAEQQVRAQLRRDAGAPGPRWRLAHAILAADQELPPPSLDDDDDDAAADAHAAHDAADAAHDDAAADDAADDAHAADAAADADADADAHAAHAADAADAADADADEAPEPDEPAAPAPRLVVAPPRDAVALARKELESVVSHAPGFAWAWLDLARISERLGELPGALDEARAAADAATDHHHPQAGYFWAQVARLAVRANDEPGRATAAAHAARLAPTLKAAQLEGARESLEAGDLVSARGLMDLLRAVWPRDLAVLDLARTIDRAEN